VISYLEKRQKTLPYRILSAFIAFSFIFSLVLPPSYAQSVLNLPAPGTMVTPAAAFTPALIDGITIHPENPLQFDFIVNIGDSKLGGKELTKEANKLIKYFLAALTVPEKELWVNLSPYEKDRIIPQSFGNTEMGRDLLAQDYILKQLTASLMYPEKELGKKFWDKIYKQAREKYGTTEIPMDTFNKVWIVPEDAVIYEQDDSAFVVKSHLKVMLESDYEAQKQDAISSALDTSKSSIEHPASNIETSIIKEVILPELEREVNEGQTFANLRQIYNSTILATWYKMTLKESLLGQVYVDQNKTKGIDTQDKQVNEKIYNQYLEAFKKGVYNYIKEDYDEATKEVIPRKYFSGGAALTLTEATNVNTKPALSRLRRGGNGAVDMLALGGSLAGDGGISQAGAKAIITSGLKQGPHFEFEVNLKELGSQIDPAYYDTLAQQISNGAVFNPSTPASSPISDDSYLGASKAQALGQIARYRENNFKFFDAYEDLEFKGSIDRAFKFLNHPSSGQKVMVVENAGSKEGTVFGAVQLNDGTIIIERTFLNGILVKQNPFDMRTRVFINLLREGTAHEKRLSEYQYAKQAFPEEINNLLPKKGVAVDQVEQNIRRNILPLQDIAKLRSDPVLGQYRITEASEETKEIAKELESIAVTALYEITINILNKTIDPKKRIRLSDDDPVFLQSEVEGDRVRLGMLAFATNPPTIAHLFVAGLQAMAKSKSDRFILAPTRGDDRKPELLETYEFRNKLTSDLVQPMLGGLIDILPQLKEDNKADHGWNGEEKILPIFRLNTEIKLTLLYGAGDDHYSAIKRDKNGSFTWDGLTWNNRYYFQLSDYKKIMQWFLDFNKEDLSGDEVIFLTQLIASPKPVADMLESIINAKVPRIDTVMKQPLSKANLTVGQIRRNIILE
jgi:hypothetical protein